MIFEAAVDVNTYLIHCKRLSQAQSFKLKELILDTFQLNCVSALKGLEGQLIFLDFLIKRFQKGMPKARFIFYWLLTVLFFISTRRLSYMEILF